jgi:alpha-mannosidase
MKFTELTVLLPCHSLEDFPTYYDGPQADELLAAWCAPWHPALLASASAVPNWHRIDVPPESLENRLITLPPFCTDRLPAGFVARAQTEGACLVRRNSLEAAVAAALEGLDGGAAGIDKQLATDFLALGFCRLQIELLTRQMRYSTHIDETHFQNEAVAAAKASLEHDEATARQHLNLCFETLYEARKHFYPVDAHLLDLTLLAGTTLGAPLAAELAQATPANLLTTSSLLRQIASDQPATWASLLSAIDQGKACVLGGDQEERELPLLPLETVRREIGAGVTQYESLLGRRPRVYARRRFGLWPLLPQILTKFGYQGALHFTLDDGRFPLGTQCKTRWEGLDSSAIDIFSQLPCDAARPESLLGFSRKMADSMDSDHVATVAFAHWPGQTSPWYGVLCRVAELSPVLGKFTLLDEYFSQTDMPGRLSKFEPDEYRTPYLKQAIIRRQSDPISAFVRAHAAQAQRAAAEALSMLRDMVVGKSHPTAENDCQPNDSAAAIAEIARGLDAKLAQFAAALPRKTQGSSPGRLIANPLSFARKIGVELPQFDRLPAVVSPVAAAARTETRKFAVVDVPAMGFAWVEPGSSQSAMSRVKPIAHENVLGNEFFEVNISPKSGGISSIFSYQQRGNQLSEQIAFRSPGPPAAPGETWRNPDQDAAYTEMRADAVEIAAASTVFGEIVSRGKLLDAEGRRVAGFRQSVQVWSHSRVIRVQIELQDVEEPRADPWNSYYAARFAWPDETAELWRGVALARKSTTASRFEAPEYVELDNGSGRISILTGGLPYHRRSGDRMLDSLLVVRGETARQFTIGIGVDLSHSAAAAIELITPVTACDETTSPAANVSGWFFHMDAKNVLATHWQPLVDDRQDDGPADDAPKPVRGFRARLVETAGRAGRVTLRTFRPVAAARQIDFLGQTLVEVPFEDDKIRLDFAAHEWIEVEAVWKQ